MALRLEEQLKFTKIYNDTVQLPSSMSKIKIDFLFYLRQEGNAACHVRVCSAYFFLSLREKSPSIKFDIQNVQTGDFSVDFWGKKHAKLFFSLANI